jgi:Fic family protein
MAASKNRKSSKTPAKAGKSAAKSKAPAKKAIKPKPKSAPVKPTLKKSVLKKAAAKPKPSPKTPPPKKPAPKAAPKSGKVVAKAPIPSAKASAIKAKTMVSPAKKNHQPPPAKVPQGKGAKGPGPAKAHPADGRLNGAPSTKAPVGGGKPTKRALTANEASLPPPPARKGAARPSAPPRPAPQMREAPRMVSLPLPLLPPPKRQSVEERASQIEQRLAAAGEDFRKRYTDSLDMSWIYHDSALEGTVYTFEELRTALGGQPPPIGDSSLQPTYDDIRRHKEAIDFVRDFGEKKRLPVTVDIIKKIFLILHPEEGDIKTVKYRKDIPQHRLYFHEYAAPDKIAYKVRQIVDWLNDPETKKTRNGIRIAARAHYDLLRVYPFANDSGKVSRLFMNLLLMRTGLPPSILHSTERQRYYEALKGSATTVLQMVQEAVENALSSVEKLLDEHETRMRAFIS